MNIENGGIIEEKIRNNQLISAIRMMKRRSNDT